MPARKRLHERRLAVVDVPGQANDDLRSNGRWRFGHQNFLYDLKLRSFAEVCPEHVARKKGVQLFDGRLTILRSCVRGNVERPFPFASRGTSSSRCPTCPS